MTSRWRIPALVVFLGAVLGAHVAWLVASRTPPLIDSVTNLRNSFACYSLLHFSESGEILKAVFRSSGDYPHLEYLVSAPFYRILGTTPLAGSLSLLPWHLVFLLAMYGCGRRLCGEGGAWLLLAAAAASPLYGSFGKFYFMEVPMTAVTALSLYLYLCTDRFARPLPSLLLGLAMGLGMMIKGSTPLFMAGVLLVAHLYNVFACEGKRLVRFALLLLPLLLCRGAAALKESGLPYLFQYTAQEDIPAFLLRSALAASGLVALLFLAGARLKGDMPSRALNLLTAIAAMAGTAFPWYALNYPTVMQKMREQDVCGPKDLLPLYRFAVDVDGTVYLAWMLVALGAAVYSTRRASFERFGPLLVGFVLCFLALSFTHLGMSRYALPLTPLVLCLAALWPLEAAAHAELSALKAGLVPLVAVLVLQGAGGPVASAYPRAAQLFRQVPVTASFSAEGGAPWTEGLRIPTALAPSRTDPFRLAEALALVDAEPGARAGAAPGRVALRLRFEGPVELDRANFTVQALEEGRALTFIDYREGLDLAAQRIDFLVEVAPRRLPEPAGAPLGEVAALPLAYDNTMWIWRVLRSRPPGGRGGDLPRVGVPAAREVLRAGRKNSSRV